MQCQAIAVSTKSQCKRLADPGSRFCWQHTNYTGIVNYPEFKEQKVQSPRRPTQPVQQRLPYLDEIEFKQINNNTIAKINNEEDAINYKTVRGHNNIIAKGPLTIVLEVGEREPVVLEYELKLPAGDHTYESIIDDIRAFYNGPATHKEFFNLIRLSDELESESDRELYSILQDEATINDLRLYDLMGSSIFIEGIHKDAKSGLYYLILGN